MDNKLDLRVKNPIDVKTVTNCSYKSVGFFLSIDPSITGDSYVCSTNNIIGINIRASINLRLLRDNTCQRSHSQTPYFPKNIVGSNNPMMTIKNEITKSHLLTMLAGSMMRLNLFKGIISIKIQRE